MTVPWLHVVGIGEDGLAGLSPDTRQLIESAETLVGGARHLAMVPGTPADRLVWSQPLTATLAEIVARRGRRVVVLATGDPMFFGIGATLVRRVPIEEMRVLPHPGAFSLAAARLGWPMQGVRLITLHGRPLDQLALHLAPGARILALSENGATPAAVTEWLRQRGWGDSAIAVLERLGGRAERITDGTADNMPPGPFADLNLLAIDLRPGTGARPYSRLAGLPDAAFSHDGQLTKREVRAQTLAALAPLAGQLLWDVGAGCGSIAIEWLRAGEGMRAIAVERSPDRCALIARNARVLGVPELPVVKGSAPDALAGLPTPDAIFIGGGIDAAVLALCWTRLRPGGRLVANVVSVEGERDLSAFQAIHGGDLVRQVISRAEPLGGHTVWRALMPVTQLSITKGNG